MLPSVILNPDSAMLLAFALIVSENSLSRSPASPPAFAIPATPSVNIAPVELIPRNPLTALSASVVKNGNTLVATALRPEPKSCKPLPAVIAAMPATRKAPGSIEAAAPTDSKPAPACCAVEAANPTLVDNNPPAALIALPPVW